MKSSNQSLVPNLLIENSILQLKNSQKATLNFYFKSRFSAKPSKFQIYFTIDCRVIMQKIPGQKNSNCLFKQKFGTKTNLNMRNSMMMFKFSVFDYEYLLWANLVQRFKTVCSNLNLIQRLIQTYKTQWWCLFYLFQIENSYLFCKIWSNKLQLSV